MNEPINPSANPQGKPQRMENSQRLTYWVTLMLIFVLLGGLLPPVHAASASTMEGIPNRKPQPSSHNNAILAMDDATNEMILPPVLSEVEGIGFQPSTLISYSSMETSAASSSAEASQASASLSPSTVPPPDGGQAAQDPAQSGLLFIENLGQFDEQARFQVWGATGGDMWLAEDAMWFTVLERLPVDRLERLDVGRTDAERTNEARRGVNLKLSFPGANPHPRLEPFNRLDTHVSYLIGNDPTKWRTDVPVWGGVRYVNLYPGVDLEIMGEDGRLVQRLVVRDMPSSLAPSPGEGWGRELRLRSEGADSLSLTGDRLRLTTAVGDLTVPLLQPVAADGAPLEMPLAQPRVNGSEVTAPFSSPPSASLAPSDSSTSSSLARLASPPPIGMMSFLQQGTSDLLYATYLAGGTSYESYGIAVDGAGNAYMTGGTDMYGEFPTTPGAFQTEKPGNLDAFVVKLNASGTDLVYATYLGGSFQDAGEAIAVDGAGNAYVTGVTLSYDFIPAAVPGFDKTYAWGREAYVVKLNGTGTGLLYASYLGSVGWDWGYGIAVDATGNAYVTGFTDSSDFIPPGVPGFDTSLNDTLGDAFVAKVEADGTGLAYATYLGGASIDEGYAIAVDGVGNAYVTGYTWSNDFIPPGVPGFDTSFGGGLDTFVVKVEANGTGLAYATYLGSSSDEIGYGIAVDGLGNAYVTGQTWSSDFIPPGVSGFDTSFGGIIDAFVVKVASGGMGLVYATYLGGSQYDIGHAIAVDRTGNAYVTGVTNSWDLIPPDVPGFDTSPDYGFGNAFMAKLVSGGTGLAYATYLEGADSEEGYAIAVDGVGDAYVTGYTQSDNFIPPGVPGYDTTSDRGVFVVKLAPGGPYAISGQVTDAASTDPIPGVVVSAGGTLNTTTQASGYYTITGVISGTYTLTPTLTGYTFEPVTHTVVVTTQNVSGKNFTGTLQAYSISGQVTDAVSSQPIPGVVISAGGTLSATTQASGYYTITGVLSGTYALTPSLTGYTFEPVTRTVVVTTQSVSGRNFTGTLQTYSISGQVTDAVSGEPIPGVVVSAGGALSATTQPTGYYIITGVTNGTYTLTPILEGYTFEPATRIVVVTTQNQSGQDFTGIHQTFSISGRVTWIESGNPIGGVTVEARQGSNVIGSDTTDGTDGTYQISNLPAGTYELSVPVANADNGLLTFVSAADPDSPTIQVTLNGDVTGQDFVAKIEDPVSSGFKGANWLDLDLTNNNYPGSNVGWNLELSDTIVDYNPDDPHHPNGNDILTLNRLPNNVRTIIRLELNPPPINLRSGDCQNLIDNWVIDGVNADRQYEIMVNRVSTNSNAIPIFVLDNEPNLDWGVTAEEYAHIYNCYYQYWRLERNYPHRLFVAGPGKEPGDVANTSYTNFYQQLLSSGSETITFADGFAIHAYGYCEDCDPTNGEPGPLDYANLNGVWESGFSHWIAAWKDAVANRLDLQNRPVIITEYNPGAQSSNGNTTVNIIRSDTNGELWQDWFDKTYCWAQRIDPLIGLLYFVDEGHHSRIRDASLPGHDWDEVSLYIKPNTARAAWRGYNLNQDCNDALFAHSFQKPIFRGQDYQVLTAAYRDAGNATSSIPQYHPQAQSPVTSGFINGTISGELGIEGFDNVFYVTDNLEVLAGQTLTIAQGTTLVFAPGLRMDIAGQLIAEGNSVFPIRFVGLTEAGWGGLRFQATAQNSRCVGCYVENVADNGIAVTVDAPITFKDGQVRDIEGGTAITATIPFTLSNVVIDNVGLGLDLSGAGATTHSVSHLTLTRCQQGIVTTNQILTLDNSIVTNCTTALSTGAGGDTTARYMLFDNNLQDFVTDPAGQLNQGTGLIFNTDPGFVDFPTNHTLQPDSPAVDAADPQAPFERELGYNGGRADMGAYGNSWQAPQNPPLSQMGAELTADTTTATERSGQAVQYNLTLKNSGAVPDNYTVTVMESTFSVRTAADGYGGPRQFTLIPQETVSIPIWVDVPLAPTQLDNTVIIRAFNGYGIDETIELTTSVRVFQEVGGQVVMEGENFDGQTERGIHTWLVQDSLTGYVGAGYAAALPDTDLLVGTDDANTSSELSYTINFTTPGTYTVWLRGYAPNGAGDSLYITLDNQPAAIVTNFAPRTWAWANKDNAGLQVTIEVSEASVHTLHLWQREDGFRLDRILLTTDNGYNPTGDGPPESPIQ